MARVDAGPDPLRRAGHVLLAAGAVDVALLIVFALAGVFYPSSLNVPGLVAGHFLRRGSLRTAAVVRWTAWFTLAAVPLLLGALWAALPAGFWWALGRSWPAATVASVLAVALPLILAAWLLVALPPAADAPSAFLQRPVAAWTSAAGIALAIYLMIVAMQAIGVAQTAIAMARRQAGPAYDYVVVSLQPRLRGGALLFHAGVIAWNRDEAKYLPLEWRP